MKKLYFDFIFIVVSALILIVLIDKGVLEKYLGFSLVPMLFAYYLGQWVERKTKKKSS